MKIQQGDQYFLPVKIKLGDDYLTDVVDDVRIQIGKYLKSYAAGEIQYDSASNYWLYPLTEEMTFAMQGMLVPIQIAVRVDEDYRYSDTKSINFGESIIKKGWND